MSSDHRNRKGFVVSCPFTGVHPTHMHHQRSTEPSPSLTDGGSTSDVHRLNVLFVAASTRENIGAEESLLSRLYWFEQDRTRPESIHGRFCANDPLAREPAEL